MLPPPVFISSDNSEPKASTLKNVNQTNLPCTKTTTLYATDWVQCSNGTTITFLYSGTGSATANDCTTANTMSETNANANLAIQRNLAINKARTDCPGTTIDYFTDF